MKNSHSPSATTSLESPWPAVSGLVHSLVQQGFDWLSEYSTCMCLSRSPSPLPPPAGRRLLLLTVCSWPELLCPCCELEAAPKCKVQDLWEGSGSILGKAWWGTVYRGRSGEFSFSGEQRPDLVVKVKRRATLTGKGAGKECDKNSSPPELRTRWLSCRFYLLQEENGLHFNYSPFQGAFMDSWCS